eukprot:867311-Rhodomonas_salina.1
MLLSPYARATRSRVLADRTELYGTTRSLAPLAAYAHPVPPRVLTCASRVYLPTHTLCTPRYKWLSAYTILRPYAFSSTTDAADSAVPETILTQQILWYQRLRRKGASVLAVVHQAGCRRSAAVYGCSAA